MSAVLLSFMCPLTLMVSDPSALNQTCPQGLGWRLVFPDKKPEKHQFPKNFRSKYLGENEDFQEWLHLSHAWLTKWAYKPPRESSTSWESQRNSVLTWGSLVVAKWETISTGVAGLMETRWTSVHADPKVGHRFDIIWWYVIIFLSPQFFSDPTHPTSCPLSLSLSLPKVKIKWKSKQTIKIRQKT